MLDLLRDYINTDQEELHLWGEPELTLGSQRNMWLSHYCVVDIFGVTGREESPYTRGLVVHLVSRCEHQRRESPARPWVMNRF